MNLKTAAVVALVATVAVGTPATAATKKKAPPPVCNLVKDDKADVTVPDPALDVLSADVVSDGKKLTGVIRLAGDPDANSPASPSGRTYNLLFSGQNPSAPVFVGFIFSPNAQGGTYGYHDATTNVNNGLGDATVKIVGNDIYLTVPVGVFSPYGKFKRGNRLTDFSVTSGRMAGVYADAFYAYNTIGGDNATGDRPYTVGARSCAKLGGP